MFFVYCPIFILMSILYGKNGVNAENSAGKPWKAGFDNSAAFKTGYFYFVLALKSFFLKNPPECDKNIYVLPAVFWGEIMRFTI